MPPKGVLQLNGMASAFQQGRIRRDQMSNKTNKKSKTSSKKGTNPLLKAVQGYLKNGLPIIPVNKKHKNPSYLILAPIH